MSSGPPTNPTGRHVRARRRRGPAGWSLRTRLVLTLVGLVVAVGAIIGVFTTIVSYKVGVNRLDDQLKSAALRTMMPPPHRDNRTQAPTEPDRTDASFNQQRYDGRNLI